MKKCLLILLSSVLLFGMVGCGKVSAPTSTHQVPSLNDMNKQLGDTMESMDSDLKKLTEETDKW